MESPYLIYFGISYIRVESVKLSISRKEEAVGIHAIPSPISHASRHQGTGSPQNTGAMFAFSRFGPDSRPPPEGRAADASIRKRILTFSAPVRPASIFTDRVAPDQSRLFVRELGRDTLHNQLRERNLLHNAVLP